jgi:hypothetical protein
MSGGNDSETTIRDDIPDDVRINDTTDPDEIFHTTYTRLELALRDYNEVVKSRYRIFNTFVLFITSLSVVLVANFKQTFGISPDVWYNMFIVIAIGSFIYFVWDCYQLISNRDDARTEAVMRELRGDSSDDD